MSRAPQWLQELVNDVAAVTDSLQDEVELGCHVFRNTEDGEWEVTLFAEAPDWGGRLATASIPPVLSVDVLAITKTLDHVTNCRWQTAELSADDDLGAHLSIEGTRCGHAVWLRVLSHKPTILNETPSHFIFLQN